MTSATISQSRAATVSRSPIVFLPLILGILMLGAYSFMPFVNHPDLGTLTVADVNAERDNRKIPAFDEAGEPLLDDRERPIEYDLENNGLRMLWFAGATTLLMGVWGAIDPRVDRTLSVMTVVAGVIGLSYYVVFWRGYTADGADYLNMMALGFWAMLGIAAVMVLQVVIPRAKPLPHFQVGRMLGNQESVLIFAVAALLVVVGIINPRFLAERNLLDILQGNAYVAVAAIGMTMVIVTGNIDISVGSLIALLAIISGRIVVADLPWLPMGVQITLAWIAPLVFGVLIGGGIGWLVAYLRVPSIVVTLAMLSILKGVLIIWTSGERVTGMPEGFYLAQWKLFGVSTPIWFMLIFTALGFIWMRYSGLGRSFYAVGGNAEAARLSGLSERNVVLQAFMLNGLFAGIASLLYATQFQVIQATPPPFLELNIITAAVVGGVSILGGTGTVLGAMLAAILLNMIRSGMVFINVDPFWLKSVQGLLILVTVLADLLRRRSQRAA